MLGILIAGRKKNDVTVLLDLFVKLRTFSATFSLANLYRGNIFVCHCRCHEIITSNHTKVKDEKRLRVLL